MKLSDKIKIAFKDLINRKLRTVLTVIAISIGSLLLIIMMVILLLIGLLVMVMIMLLLRVMLIIVRM